MAYAVLPLGLGLGLGLPLLVMGALGHPVERR